MEQSMRLIVSYMLLDLNLGQITRPVLEVQYRVVMDSHSVTNGETAFALFMACTLEASQITSLSTFPNLAGDRIMSTCSILKQNTLPTSHHNALPVRFVPFSHHNRPRT